MVWWRSRYVQLLEIERERLLAELSNKDLRLDQLRKELANAGTTQPTQPVAAPVAVTRPKLRDTNTTRNFESWDSYQERYSQHFDHDTMQPGCEFCADDARARARRAEDDKKGVQVVTAKAG